MPTNYEFTDRDGTHRVFRQCKELKAENERLRTRVAELETEVEAVDDERHEIVAAITVQRDDCRRLLWEACQDPERVEVAGVRCWEILVSKRWMAAAWMAAARNAAGGDDETPDSA